MSKELLQTLYHPQATFSDIVINYERVLDDLEDFAIAPQVYFLLKQQGRLEQTPSFFQKRLKELFEQALYKNIFIKNQTSQIFTKFEDAGIAVIPLKGTFFSEKYFGHLGARPTSDIDLLIKHEKLDLAIESIKGLGFIVEEELIPNHFHTSFSKELPNSPIPLTVELHWDLIKKNTSRFNVTEFWNEANPMKDYDHVMELSLYHTFYMICLHGWRHNLDSLKYFIDIIQLLSGHHHQLDFSRLLKDAASHKTKNRIIRTLSIVYQQFPFLHEIKTLPFQRKKTYCEYQTFRNHYQKTLKTYINFFDYQIFSYDSPKHSLIEMGEWLKLFKPNFLGRRKNE